MTDLQTKLVKCANDIGQFEGPEDLTWDELADSLTSPDFEERFDGLYAPWHGLLPEELRALWQELPMEARVVAYCFGAGADAQSSAVD